MNSVIRAKGNGTVSGRHESQLRHSVAFTSVFIYLPICNVEILFSDLMGLLRGKGKLLPI